MSLRRIDLGSSNRQGSDSPSGLDEEASPDGSSLFDGSSRACRGGGGARRALASAGGGPFRRQRQHGDQLAEAGRNHRQRRAWPDRRSQAEEDRRPASRWLVGRCRERDFTLRGLVAELAERGLKVDYRSVWEFVHAEKLSYKKDADCGRTGPPRRGA